MSVCRFGVSPVNYPDPDPAPFDGSVFTFTVIMIPNDKASGLKMQ